MFRPGDIIYHRIFTRSIWYVNDIKNNAYELIDIDDIMSYHTVKDPAVMELHTKLSYDLLTDMFRKD